MKTNKVTLDIKIEVLSTDSVPALLADVADQYRKEFHTGKLAAADGDTVTWTTNLTPALI